MNFYTSDFSILLSIINFICHENIDCLLIFDFLDHYLMLTWSLQVQLVVNESKTEAVVFTKKDYIKTEIDTSGLKVTTKEVMKVLGVKLNCNLSWGPHIKNTLQKCKNGLVILKKIRNRFTKKQFAQYYSHLYYCVPVLCSDTTPYPLKKLINTAHYRPPRISLKDYRYRLSRPQRRLLSG